MASAANSSNNNTLPEDSPVAWFFVLEKARIANDYERAAEAIRQLRRLGVHVRFVGRPQGVAHAR